MKETRKNKEKFKPIFSIEEASAIANTASSRTATTNFLFIVAWFGFERIRFSIRVFVFYGFQWFQDWPDEMI
jgi:hypothetical protein